LATSEQLGLLPEQAKLLVQIGEIHYRKGELADAETLYVKGAGKCKELGDLSGYASTLAKLGALRDMQGFMNEGIALCQEAIAIAESINDGWVVAQADLNLSNIYRRALNWTPGLEAAQRAYDFFKGRSRGQFANKALVNIVALWAELGEWQKVDHVSDELMESLIAAGDVRTLSQLKNNLGVVAFDQENYQAAEASWQEALRLNSQIQEPTELANLYNNLGVVYTRMREWEAAEEMLKMAAKAHRELGDAYNGANSLDNLADMYEAKGDTAACRRVLEEAEDGLLALVDNPHAEDLRRNIRERLASLPVS
jgi:tetratricopeptide (TPR) repeat protein